MPSEVMELQESSSSAKKAFDNATDDQQQQYDQDAYCHDDDSSSASSSVELPPFFHPNHPEPFHLANNDEVIVEEEEERSYSFILGKRYARERDDHERVAVEQSLFWFTYRAGFTEIQPYGYTSDAGWGCMLRASQMLLAQALRVHFKGREWGPAPTYTERRHRGSFYGRVLTWFADFPGVECCYSLHNMIAAGLTLEKFPGEWYGPGSAAYVIRELCGIHQTYMERSVAKGLVCDEISQRGLFRVVVAQEGCVYLDAIENKMCCSDSKTESSSSCEDNGNNGSLKANSKSSESGGAIFDPLLNPDTTIAVKPPWKVPLLLIVPLRLGLNKFNASYCQSITHFFSLSQSVGLIGGNPNKALWFYGASSDGKYIYGLDPHTVQQSPVRDSRLYGAIFLSDAYMQSVHCARPAEVIMSRIDPSLALAFYCKDRDDLQNLCNEMTKFRHNDNSSPELFSIVERAPDYTADLSAFAEMMGTGDDEPTDEDEYVFL
mmetsp:Transcript_2850/g.4487  ORF Transcript_2850/g.4487 Transcript_2850/m.4487 type:complete len:491 (+) Transcript_2850:120-1592(+)